MSSKTNHCKNIAEKNILEKSYMKISCDKQ